MQTKNSSQCQMVSVRQCWNCHMVLTDTIRYYDVCVYLHISKSGSVFGNLVAKSTSRKWEYGSGWFGNGSWIWQESLSLTEILLRVKRSFQHKLKVIFNIKKLSDVMLLGMCWVKRQLEIWLTWLCSNQMNNLENLSVPGLTDQNNSMMFFQKKFDTKSQLTQIKVNMHITQPKQNLKKPKHWPNPMGEIHSIHH